MKTLKTTLLLLLLASAAWAHAAWNAKAESIASHDTWIYTPAKTLSGGKRGLLVVLHGCDQTGVDLRDYGNLQGMSDETGLVLALPQVGSSDAWGPGCWDYDRARDNHHHVAEIIDLTRNLLGRENLNVDPKQVFVAGVSSGGSLALLLACAAPDLYAGVGAVAAPSVGSDQSHAVDPAADIPNQNSSRALNQCRSLAAEKSESFSTQVANLAYGTMDRDGLGDMSRALGAWSAWMCPKRSGQCPAVSVRWSQDNAEMFKRLYETDGADSGAAIEDGLAYERSAKKDGAVRVALVAMEDVGHAWPAGTGRANDQSGPWIAQRGLNYPRYIARWFLANNRRAGH